MQGTGRIRRTLAALVAAALMAGGVAVASPAGAATEDNTMYVRALYGDLLERVPPDTTDDDAGVEYWADQLDDGVPRATVAEGIQRSSNEYYSRITEINYAIFLNRSPDIGGLEFYVPRWRNRTLTLDSIVVALTQSAEYYARHGSNDAQFIDALYFDILGRRADDGGAAYAQTVIDNQSRGRLAKNLQTSREKRNQVVNDRYGTFLGRSPGAQARNYWVDQLGSGLRIEEFDVTLLATNEYYDLET